MGRVEQEKGVLIMNVHNSQTVPPHWMKKKKKSRVDTSQWRVFFFILQIVVMMFTWSRSSGFNPLRACAHREQSLYVSGQKNTQTEISIHHDVLLLLPPVYVGGNDRAMTHKIPFFILFLF